MTYVNIIHCLEVEDIDGNVKKRVVVTVDGVAGRRAECMQELGYYLQQPWIISRTEACDRRSTKSGRLT